LTSRIQQLLAPFTHLRFDSEAAIHYAEIRFHLEKHGTPVSPDILFIAAATRAAGATLVTANIREFRRVPDLKCGDWAVWIIIPRFQGYHLAMDRKVRSFG
jgi:tRNA(fMet)-specific endonuclease VapC